MTYNFGDILLVPFLFTDQTTTKKRPTVVISSNKYNTQKPDLIVMAVTSQINSSLSFYEMLINNFASAGLLKPSLIKPIINYYRKKFGN